MARRGRDANRLALREGDEGALCQKSNVRLVVLNYRTEDMLVYTGFWLGDYLYLFASFPVICVSAELLGENSVELLSMLIYKARRYSKCDS